MPYDYVANHPGLLREVPIANKRERKFLIDLPEMPAGRSLGEAYLVIPDRFPDARLKVCLSSSLALTVPHVERSGKVCFDGDPGPRAGLGHSDRVNYTLERFILDFVIPWGARELDNEFEKEARTYWELYVGTVSSAADAVTEVYTLDAWSADIRTYAADLVLPGRWVLAGRDSRLVDAVKKSLSARINQVIKTRVLQIPVPNEFTPLTWPRNRKDIERLIHSRVVGQADEILSQFIKSRELYRVVIFSTPNCDYPYLLPGGPPVPRKALKGVKPIPADRLVPLVSNRLDPSWTYGRDKHPKVLMRQQKHIVVFGAGALGSPIVDQLARAGVGRISLIDPDFFQPPNVGRHLLGLSSLGLGKASQVCAHVSAANPACSLYPFATTAEKWLSENGLYGIDAILDLTGEPDVRDAVQKARGQLHIPLLIGWMEPYVAAAHACVLLPKDDWTTSNNDPLEMLQAVTWPDDVISFEPACNSEFQAYTASAALHAVALIAEAALALVDDELSRSIIKSWVRGQQYLDLHYPGLILRDWAVAARAHDGLVIERDWNENSAP